MASETSRARVLERLSRLSRSTHDGASIQLEVIAQLKRVVGFERWCLPFADPDTLMPVDGIAEHDYLPGVPRLLELEYSVDRFAAKELLAKLPRPAASLNAETGGDLARSARWDQVMRPVGIGDVAAVACRDALGCWGWIEIYRDRDEPPFTDADLELLARVGSIIAPVLRTKGTYASLKGYVDTLPPGVMVFDADLRLLKWTSAAVAWASALNAPFARSWVMPAWIYPVLVRAGARQAGARALSLARDGRWVMLEAALLEGEPGSDIAVTMRAAAPAEILHTMSRVYGLSRREREVVEQVIAGFDTRGLSQRLFISEHTVQDHLKSIFEKTQVHSRRELIALFVAPPAAT